MKDTHETGGDTGSIGYRMDWSEEESTGRPTIAELYVYPVKACQGVRVREGAGLGGVRAARVGARAPPHQLEIGGWERFRWGGLFSGQFCEN